MKSTCHLSLAACFLLLTACNKETNLKPEEAFLSGDGLNKKELEYIHSLELGLSKIEITEKSYNPENPNNPFDYLGSNIRAMLGQVNELEYDSPSATSDEYVAQWNSILPDYEAGFHTNIVEDHLSLEARRLLAELIRSTIDFSNAQLSIEQIKFLEDEIAQSDFIHQATREYLLSYSSMIRNVVWFVEHTGIVVAGTHYDSTQLPPAWWDCFDNYFEEAAERNFGVLVDLDSPIATAFAWVGLPATLVGAVGDSIYQGVVNTVNNPNC